MVNIAFRATSHVAAWLVWHSMRVSLLEDQPSQQARSRGRRSTHAA